MRGRNGLLSMVIAACARRGWSRVAPCAAAVCLVVTASSCVPPRGAGAGGGGRDSAAVPVTRVLNLRLHGSGDVASPPILRLPLDGQPSSGVGNDALTAEFEMQSVGLPAVTLMLVHCDHNWVPTENIFVQDESRLQGNEFEVERAPVGATHYDYILRITFPRQNIRPEILFSGNYLARIVDYYDRRHVLAEARFFAVEPRTQFDVTTISDFYESAATKVLQHGLKVRVEATPKSGAFGGVINSIQLYPAGEWYSPIVADDDHESVWGEKGMPWTRWSAGFVGKATAEFANIPAGNEHRLLDLTDIVQYPTVPAYLSTPLSDIARQSIGPYDNDGETPDRLVPTSDADYVNFQFRLDLQGRQAEEDIFVVGTFSNWRILPEWQLHYDKTTGFYTARGLLRRAFHEYEYRTGHWDADSAVLRDADPTLLEGNWAMTTRPFYVMTYFRETSGGGYDKLIGVGLGVGGNRR